MIYYPFLWIVLSYIEVKGPTMAQLTLIAIVGTLLLIFLAYWIMVFLDRPIRNYLKRL